MKHPIQVYLDDRDRSMLRRLSQRLALSQAETVREAIRRWAMELSGDEDPVLRLIGGLDDPAVPADLSTRHDAYAVTEYRSARVAEPHPKEDTAE